MKEKLLSIFTFCKSYVLTIVAIGGILWASFKFVNATTENISQTVILASEMKEMNESLTRQIENLATQQQCMVNSLQDVSLQISDINSANNAWHTSYTLFVRENSKTTNDLFRYLEGLDLALKKN
jgi:hypothetical protein